MGIAFLVVAVGPAAAQNQVGDVYCNTGVATGIDLVFGAIAGLGLPATAFYIGTAGLSYMRAGGNPEEERCQGETRYVRHRLRHRRPCTRLTRTHR